MVDPTTRSDSLTLNGRWRITHFGKLEQNPASSTRDLKIEVFLGRLVHTGDTLTLDKTVRQKCSVLVGEIPRLPINTVLVDGRPSNEKRDFGKKRGVQLSLNCRKQNLHVFDRFERDQNNQRIVPHNLWSKDAEQSENTLFVGFRRDADPFGIVIPCYEIFRFFYATSDVITKALLSYRFLDPGTHIWDTKKSRLTEGQAYLWLRKCMLDSDARFIARFAFDPYALKRAQDIFLYAAATHSQNKQSKLRALPPFEDTVKIQALGKELPNGRVLVFEILSCNYCPNFSELHWDRDNDGRYNPDHREERAPTDYQGKLFQPSSQSDISGFFDTPPTDDLPPARLQFAEIRERFPALADIPAQKLPQDNTKTRADKKTVATVFVDVSKGSVSEGQSSEELVGRVIIESKETLLRRKPTLSTNIDPSIGDGFEYILNLLTDAEKSHGANVRQLVFTNEYALHKNIAFNLFPKEINGKKSAWLFSDQDRKFQRMVLVAEITTECRTRYVIELQHRMQNRCSTLILWNSEESVMLEVELHELLLDCASASGASFPSANHRGFRWGRREHTVDITHKNAGKIFLTKTFTAKAIKDKAMLTQA